MRSVLYAFICLCLMASCAQSQTATLKFPEGSKKPVKGEVVATFAEGCFWHSEIIFQSLEGVRDAVSGYSGGSVAHPDYETVCSGTTGHAEAVQVYYDPTKISYETLVKAFFASHDPTQVDRQGNDVGSQYRSAVYYRNEAEKKVIDAEIKRLAAAKTYPGKIVTEVLPFKNFYPAEAYHQEYIIYHPNNPYVKNVSIRDYEEFRRTFKGKFKQSAG